MILNQKPYEATRLTVGDIDSHGEYQDAIQATFTVVGYIEEATPRTLVVLDDEGARSRAKFVMVTEPDQSELHVMETLPRRRADRVTYKGRQYAVIEARDNTDHTEGIPHYWYALSEIGPDE